MRRLVALACLVAASCGGDHSFIVVDVTSTSTSLTLLALDVSVANGGQTANLTVTRNGTFTVPPSFTFAIQLDPSRTGYAALAVDAIGTTGVVAHAEARATITPGGTSSVTIDLMPPSPDMAVDMAMPDGAAPDEATPDEAMPDEAMPDLATPDLAMPDFRMPDLAMPDLRMPDLATPDLATPDLATPDLATPDLATPDLAPYPDLHQPPTPVVLASSQIGPGFLAVDGVNAYWTTNAPQNKVMAVPIGGGQAVELAPVITAAGDSGAYGMATDGQFVYWANYSPGAPALQKVAVTGGAVTTLGGTSYSYPQNVALSSTNVFWDNYASGPINTVPKSGGGTSQVWGGGLGTYVTERLITDSTTYLYFSACSGGACEGHETIYRVPLGGGSPTTLASNRNTVAAFAIDGNNLYWAEYGSSGANYSDGVIAGVPINGGGVTTYASGVHYGSGVAVDGSYVYATSGGTPNGFTDGAVLRVPLGGGAPTTLAANRHNPSFLCADVANLYWIDAGDGTIVKMAKQ